MAPGPTDQTAQCNRSDYEEICDGFLVEQTNQ